MREVVSARFETEIVERLEAVGAGLPGRRSTALREAVHRGLPIFEAERKRRPKAKRRTPRAEERAA